MIVQLTEKNGTKYKIPSAIGYYVIPRTEWLLHDVKKIEQKLLKWYKINIYNNGSDYSVSINNTGKWIVSHYNDYPMQHGEGGSHIFNDDDFASAMKLKV